MRMILAALAALVLPATAVAQDDVRTVWHFVSTDSTGAMAYSEAGAPVNGILVAFYTPDNPADSADDDYRGDIMELEIDCAHNRARNVLQVWYDKDLVRADSRNDASDWQVLEPDDLNIDRLMADKCAGKPLYGNETLTGDGSAVLVWLKAHFDKK